MKAVLSKALAGGSCGGANGWRDTMSRMSNLVFGANASDVLDGEALSGDLCGEQGNDVVFGKGNDLLFGGGSDTDRNLSAEQREAGEGHFSDQYLHDRADMFNSLAQANVKDQPFDNDPTAVNAWFYADLSSNTQVMRTPVGPGGATRFVTFGTAAGDALGGGGLGDHLYGAAGSDALTGNGGADYLEGGADDDMLDGGAGSDTLAGGAGNDTYTFSDGFGTDVILDADGRGRSASANDANWNGRARACSA